jgi:hypothetical protein
MGCSSGELIEHLWINFMEHQVSVDAHNDQSLIPLRLPLDQMQLKVRIFVTKLQVYVQSVKSNTKCSDKKKEKNSTFSQKLAGEEVGFTLSCSFSSLL